VPGAWIGSVEPELRPHALASIADLPVKRVAVARHVIANLALDIGEVALGYLPTTETVTENLKPAVNL
jgi:acetoacetate decarboxylase